MRMKSFIPETYHPFYESLKYHDSKGDNDSDAEYVDSD